MNIRYIMMSIWTSTILCRSHALSAHHLKNVLPLVPSFMSANKLNTLMILVYNHSGGLSEVTKLKKAIGHQRYFQSNIYSAPVPGLLGLDIPNSKQLTAHSYIMAIKCNNTKVFLFTDVNPSWDGYAINVLFSKKFDKEAQFKAENLVAYAYHDLGNPGLEFFSEDMKAVKLVGWVEDNNCPLMASAQKINWKF